MRTCSTCGAPVKDGDRFCQNCGSALPELPKEMPESEVDTGSETAAGTEESEYSNPAGEAPAEKKTKKKKTGLVIGIIAAVAVIAAAAAFVLTRVKSKPMARFYQAQTRLMSVGDNIGGEANSIEKFLRGEAEAFEEMKQISTDATLRVEGEGLDELVGMDVFSKLDMSFSLVPEELTYFSVNYKGSPVLSATVTNQDGKFGIYIPELSDEYYVIEPELLSDMLGSGNMLVVTGEGGGTVEFTRVDLSRTYDALAARYGKVLALGFAEEDFTDEACTRLNGMERDINGTAIIYRPNAERLAAMFSALAEELRNDEELSNYLLSLAEHYLGSAYLNMYAGEMLEGGNGLVDKLNELADELKENAQDMANQAVEKNLVWKCVVEGREIVAEYITWDGGECSFECPDGLNYYMKMTDTEEESDFTVLTDFEEKSGVVNGTITVDMDSDERVHMVCTVTGEDSKRTSALNIPVGTYDFAIDADGDKLGLKIEVTPLEGGGTEHRIEITGLDELTDGEAPERIAIVIGTTDQPGTARAPEKTPHPITTEEELQAVLDKYSENIQTVLFRLMFQLAL